MAASSAKPVGLLACRNGLQNPESQNWSDHIIFAVRDTTLVTTNPLPPSKVANIRERVMAVLGGVANQCLDQTGFFYSGRPSLAQRKRVPIRDASRWGGGRTLLPAPKSPKPSALKSLQQ